MKLFHLHLQDPMGNPSTLICNLILGSITYKYFSGHSSSGTPCSLSNLQCTLPIEKETDDETKEQFTSRVVDLINKKSVKQVVKQVSTQITF